MKNGLFKLLGALSLGVFCLQLTGCAGFLDLTEREDPSEYDRGYHAASDDEDDCDGGDCNTQQEEYSRSYASEEQPKTHSRVKRAIQTRDVILGMTRQEVEESWGSPNQREVAGSSASGHERWKYGSRYSLGNERTVIFEDGKVAGWSR